jgi:hypothetical protein
VWNKKRDCVDSKGYKTLKPSKSKLGRSATRARIEEALLGTKSVNRNKVGVHFRAIAVQQKIVYEDLFVSKEI